MVQARQNPHAPPLSTSRHLPVKASGTPKLSTSRHRKMLDRLQIYDTDIKEENFLGGLLVDLSATHVL
jgi:hypothetical protein